MSINAIITVFKRNNYNNQLRSLLAQTILPAEIYIWQNESHVNVEIDKDIFISASNMNIQIHHIHSINTNFKFHGRFTLPLLFQCDYVAIFDDDTVPGKKWFENCIRSVNTYNSIVGANGRTNIHNSNNEVGVGDGSPVDRDTIVDFVGHCWFFRREWIHHMWSFPAYTFVNGEDIHFAASSKIRENISCVVPMQPHSDRDLWGDTQNYLGLDEYATWRTPTHASDRENVKKYWVDLGWNTINKLK